MINKYLTIVSSIFLSLIGCDQSKNEQQEICATVDSFYAAEPVGNYRLVNHRYLSSDMVALLQKSSIIQSADSARLKALGSTDKPLMIEGDIFTSILEGSTYHTVEGILLDNSKKNPSIGSNSQAFVTVKFSNQQYDNYTWRDTLEMIQENGDWKIHDVRYTKGAGSQPTLKKTLLEFLKMGNTQLIE
ncbi:MAG: DUF3828 domain-containing protein [Bacteroidota bacterium]|jgi:hypothetical protein